MHQTDDLLRAYDIETGALIYTWTYSVFEKFAGQAISPSMYAWMSAYVGDIRLTYDDHELVDHLNKDAVDAYYHLSIEERTRLHHMNTDAGREEECISFA